MARLNGTIGRHADAIDSLVGEFTGKLQVMLDKASSALLSELRSKLTISAGRVSSTSANQKIIRRLDDRFMELLNEEGYGKLLDSYVDSFNGQFEWFDKVLADISDEVQYPLPFTKFPKADAAEFNAYQAGTKDLLQTAVETVAARAKKQAILSSGGMEVKQLTQHISDTLATSMAESQNLAETSISSFYRTITDKGFQIIEDDLPGFEIRYNYEGPLDKITRPFCTKLERLSRGGRTWTRAEITKMNNGQLPNVFVTGGGYRCRHQWVISASDLKRQLKSKGAPKKAEKKAAAPDRKKLEREIANRRADHVRRFKEKTGADHPHEQINAIRQGLQDMIRQQRKVS